jgi:hypothetical protein
MSLPIPIWASKVANLSDARYFAAAGVNILGFLVNNNTDMNSLTELKSWVEGPLFAIEIESFTEDEMIEKAINFLEPDIIRFPAFWDGRIDYKCSRAYFTDLYDEGIPAQENHIYLVESQSLPAISMPNHCFVENNDPVNLIDLSMTLSFGLIIKGSDEDAVGIKSFDELDAFFENIEALS